MKQLVDFIADRWKRIERGPSVEWLDDYARRYEARPVPGNNGAGEKRGPRALDRSEDLNLDFASYAELILQNHGRKPRPDWTIHVDGPDSFLQEVEACREVFSSEPSYAKMPEGDRKLVSGWGDRTSGYYGSMKAAGNFKKLTRMHPEKLGAFLDEIPLSGTVTIEQARSYLRGIMGVEGVALAGATRLLCMKRPDRFVPANGANLAGIRHHFGTTPDTIESYLALVNRIWGYRWFSAPKPKDRTAARIWDARVALLDAVFYEHAQ